MESKARGILLDFDHTLFDTDRFFWVDLKSAFSDLRPYLFPDVLEFLDAARYRGFELILLSFGDPAWQNYKVRASGLTPYFTQIAYTAKEAGKAALCAERALQYRELYAIDNNPANLDAMKASTPRLQ